MAYLEHGPRVGRSQGTSIFWGLVSASFAAAACYYFWANHQNEVAANKYRDEIITLQESQDELKAEKEKLQTSLVDRETQVKAHEDVLSDKEAQLADEETRLDALSQQLQNPAASGPGQLAVIRKFGDALRKLAPGQNAEVVSRGGRPVLRIPSTSFFVPGDAALKPEGKALLGQIALALKAASDNFELRIESFTDSAGEVAQPTSDSGPAWNLTAARAAAITQYLRDQSPLPWQNVIVVARGDTPSAGKGKADPLTPHLEITLAPVPPLFHAADIANAGSAEASPPRTAR